MSRVKERKTIVEEIEKCFQTHDVDKIYENRAYEPKEKPWMRITLHSTTSEQISLGCTPEFRYGGLITLQIFIALHEGESKILEILDIFEKHFTAKRFSNIVIGVGAIDNRTSVDGWHQVNYSIPFFRDE